MKSAEAQRLEAQVALIARMMVTDDRNAKALAGMVLDLRELYADAIGMYYGFNVWAATRFTKSPGYIGTLLWVARHPDEFAKREQVRTDTMSASYARLCQDFQTLDNVAKKRFLSWGRAQLGVGARLI